VSSRAVVVTALLAAMPAQCSKVMGKKPAASAEPAPTAAPTPVVVTSATTPPIWSPPDTTGGTTTTATQTGTAKEPGVSAELAKAKTAAEQKDHKKVKALLEKKVHGGKGTTEEARLLLAACTQLKDKTCIADVKKQHPEAVE